MRALLLLTSVLLFACGNTNAATEPTDPDALAELSRQCACLAPGCITSAAALESTLCRMQTSTRAFVRITATATGTGQPCPRVVDALFSLDGDPEFYAVESGALVECSSMGFDTTCGPPAIYCLPCPRAYVGELASDLNDPDIKAGPCQ